MARDERHRTRHCHHVAWDSAPTYGSERMIDLACPPTEHSRSTQLAVTNAFDMGADTTLGLALGSIQPIVTAATGSLRGALENWGLT